MKNFISNERKDKLEGILLFALAVLFFIAGLGVLSSDGQTIHPPFAKAKAFNQKYGVYKGFEGSFGFRKYTISSTINELNQLAVNQEGGRIGLVAGNRIIQISIELLGYYYSTGNMKGTIDLYESGAAFNFYPLALLLDKEIRVAPYLIGGCTYERVKFSGHYLTKDSTPINYSTSEDPFLGSVNQLSTYVGAGVEFKIIHQYDFVHLFSEVKYGVNISSNTKYNEFKSTSLGSQTLINIGVRFGSKQ